MATLSGFCCLSKLMTENQNITFPATDWMDSLFLISDLLLSHQNYFNAISIQFQSRKCVMEQSYLTYSRRSVFKKRIPSPFNA